MFVFKMEIRTILKVNGFRFTLIEFQCSLWNSLGVLLISSSCLVFSELLSDDDYWSLLFHFSCSLGVLLIFPLF